MTGNEKLTYVIPLLSKAVDVLELLQAGGQAMTPTELYQRTRLPPTTIYRILKTLVHRGYVLQLPNGYRYLAMQRKLRFGFLAQSSKSTFSDEVSDSLSEAASGAGVEPLIFEGASAATIRNAEELLRRRADLIIECHLAEDVAAIIGHMTAAARVPLIAVDMPSPHATYLGLVSRHSLLSACSAYVGKNAPWTLARWPMAVRAGLLDCLSLFPGSGKGTGSHGLLNGLDWNRSGVQRLIFDAEDAVCFLTNALVNPDAEKRAHAMRYGRLIYKELVNRRRHFLLPPVSISALEQLFDRIRAALRCLRESLPGV